jgi:hypothetical protein
LHPTSIKRPDRERRDPDIVYRTAARLMRKSDLTIVKRDIARCARYRLAGRLGNRPSKS